MFFIDDDLSLLNFPAFVLLVDQELLSRHLVSGGDLLGLLMAAGSGSVEEMKR
eukprot:m.10058 g.10058  ORF g.10058 m.10058 type:complete len:53 (+) comp5913_c0_seq1:2434-2592(+)